MTVASRWRWWWRWSAPCIRIWLSRMHWRRWSVSTVCLKWWRWWCTTLCETSVSISSVAMWRWRAPIYRRPRSSGHARPWTRRDTWSNTGRYTRLTLTIASPSVTRWWSRSHWVLPRRPSSSTENIPHYTIYKRLHDGLRVCWKMNIHIKNSFHSNRKPISRWGVMLISSFHCRCKFVVHAMNP